ncbi:unnamed protein product [Rangifer tarandus platyrhynchus]|uniref:Uncharacterized protein n=1 Tax=Rangifer tarandus platyrhynchus TaxID=3082113 RepID=A0ABN9A4T1_RANTA|nr:unnamed protein product [Rangifer tarandus platyrhynchus]
MEPLRQAPLILLLQPACTCRSQGNGGGPAGFRLATPLVPTPGPAFPLGHAPGPRRRPCPVPADLAPRLRDPHGGNAQFPCSGVHSAQSGKLPAVSQVRPRVSQPVGGGPAARPSRLTAAVTHRPSRGPKAAVSRCLGALPAHHQRSGNEMERLPDLRDGQARTSWGGGGRFPCHQPKAGRKGPARAAQTELREAGGASEPRVTGRHPGGSSSGESRR